MVNGHLLKYFPQWAQFAKIAPPPPLPHKSLRDCCVTFKPKSYLNILFSMQARTTIQRQYIYFASETEGIEVHDL